MILRPWGNASYVFILGNKSKAKLQGKGLTRFFRNAPYDDWKVLSFTYSKFYKSKFLHVVV